MQAWWGILYLACHVLAFIAVTKMVISLKMNQMCYLLLSFSRYMYYDIAAEIL